MRPNQKLEAFKFGAILVQTFTSKGGSKCTKESAQKKIQQRSKRKLKPIVDEFQKYASKVSQIWAKIMDNLEQVCCQNEGTREPSFLC